MDPDSIGSMDPDLGVQKLPTKIEKEMSCFEMLHVLFCGMVASSVAWTYFMRPRDR
jgi:hypothetical protein